MAIKKWAYRALIGSITVVTSFLIHAKPTYVYESMAYGDTAGVVDLNDLGLVVWTGFCDGYCHSEIGIIGPNRGDWVRGYDPIDPYLRVFVTDINNNGDLVGTAPKNGVMVPTIWLGSIPYDLTEPANSNLHFRFDAGPKSVTFGDILELDVVNLPDVFKPNENGERAARPANIALTNARGDFVFSYRPNFSASFDSFGALIAVQPVPEPNSGALMILGIVFGAAHLLRSKRKNRQK